MSPAGVFPPGVMTIGRLAGVALGGTHSGTLPSEKAPEGSEPIDSESEGKSLKRDCRSLLSELSSSLSGDGDQDLGCWYELPVTGAAGTELFGIVVVGDEVGG